MSIKEQRMAMAAKFETTQRAMSTTVDDLALARRSAVPYPSSWTGGSISETGPIPCDGHLLPSSYVIAPRSSKTIFKKAPVRNIKPPPSDGGPSGLPRDEEMERTRYMEWTLQKNAFNPDIAAALRTNVNKQAKLQLLDPMLNQDPARTSENVRAALCHSDTTGPAPAVPKGYTTPFEYAPIG